MPILPKWGDDFYDLLFKCVQNTEALVSGGFVAPKWGDSQYDLLFKLAQNLDNAGGGGSGSTAQVVSTPSGINDFSTLPGGVAPTTGVYFAPRDQITLWTIEGGDTQWTVIDKNSP